jgi:hypothetical protein
MTVHARRYAAQVIELDRDPGLVFDGETLLTPPDRPGDCTCVFCCHFRGRHYLLRALFFTALTIGAFASTTLFVEVRQKVVVMLVATTMTVPTVLCWIKPIRRVRHMRRPKTTDWPPPLPR